MLISSEDLAHEILDVVPVVMRMIRTEMRNRRSSDLTVPHFRTLVFLKRNPGTSLLSVAEHLGLTSPTVCKMVDGMVLNHLVTRTSSSTDRRKIVLTLTPDGQAMLEKARKGTQVRLVEVLYHLSPQERETVFQALKLLQNLFSPRSDREDKKK